MITYTYYDMYGFKVENTGYTLNEILRSPRVVRFRHAKPQEREILKRWIFQNKIDGVYYFGFELPRKLPFDINKLPELTRFDAVKLSRFKVDCVLKTADTLYVIEVKDYLMTTALSQPIIYEELIKKYLKPKEKTVKTLICGEAALEVEEIARKLNIQVYNLHIPTTRKHILELISPK